VTTLATSAQCPNPQGVTIRRARANSAAADSPWHEPASNASQRQRQRQRRQQAARGGLRATWRSSIIAR
jgi:hypothetical protein